MTARDTTAPFDIPGEQTFWSGPVPPPIAVTLPLAAEARLSWLALLVAVLGVFSLFCAFLLGMGSDWAGSVAKVLGTAVMTSWFAALGFALSAAAVTAVVDVWRRQPLLVLSPDGFQDRRAGADAIAWSDVAAARLVYGRGGLFAVLLRLRHPIGARHNRFRMGTLTVHWRRRPDEIYVPVIHLSVRPHVLGHTMLALVRRHGGAAQS